MHKNETILADRILRFDGISIVDPDALIALILSGVQLSTLQVKEFTPEIETFNRRVIHADKICLASADQAVPQFNWILPDAYLQLNVEGFILEKFAEFSARFSEEKLTIAATRVLEELDQIRIRGLTDLFRAIIYVIDQFRERAVVCGVGRGSSCASYILFFLGLHCVDCLKYDIPCSEFFHD